MSLFMARVKGSLPFDLWTGKANKMPIHEAPNTKPTCLDSSGLLDSIRESVYTARCKLRMPSQYLSKFRSQKGCNVDKNSAKPGLRPAKH
jgi:hypothetical protein